MPGWVSDSQFQRVEWLNSLLQKVWPQVSVALESEVKRAVQPMLDAQRPTAGVLSRVCIELSRFSMGSISPKVVGIRWYDTTDAVVRMDVELRWSGDPSIIINLGVNGSSSSGNDRTSSAAAPKINTAATMSTPIEVSELRFSATARVELLDLRPKLPCFRAVSVTFMKKPTVDFSLKVAKLDVMNIGAAEFNVTAFVRTLLHNALSEAALYPRKIVVPLQQGEDVEEYTAMHPVGILYLTFVKGTDLKKANIFGSDPYVLAKSLHQEVRTGVKYYSLNPRWDETHDFMVYDKASQEVDLQVGVSGGGEMFDSVIFVFFIYLII